MRLSFYGAAGGVTGSCFLLESGSGKILVDCGMFQGSNFNEGKNHDDFPFDPKSIDALLVTHAHLDHIGRIPKLIKDGFVGPIYATKATCELAKIVWADAYHIMEYNHRKFQSPILFDMEDVEAASALCEGVEYNKKINLWKGCEVVWKNAGHIFGASFIEMEIGGKKICFSGDIGNSNVPILKETDQLGEVDFMLCESTYGDRKHESRRESIELILKLVKEGCRKKGTIMVPSFSLERTQEFLYDLNKLSEAGELPNIPIFLDSPMAIDAIKVYKKYPEYYDNQAAALHESGDDFFKFPQIVFTYSRDESKRINELKGPKMIIAGAGMMNGGRIIHHAHRYLSDPNSTLIIIGYQARGTLGRRLYEGEKSVVIFGDIIPVNCTIRAIGGLSAHGDQDKIISWIRNAEGMPKQVYCVHGEHHSSRVLANKLKEDLNIQAFVPREGESVEI